MTLEYKFYWQTAWIDYNPAAKKIGLSYEKMLAGTIDSRSRIQGRVQEYV